MSNQESVVTKAVPRTEGFTQVCVWEGTLCGADKVGEFVEFIKNEFNIEIQYLEEIETKPDSCLIHDGDIRGTGGRNDIFFAVKDGDQSKGSFITKRLQYGIRWVEDVLSRVNNGLDDNGDPRLYPKHVLEYISWDC